MKAASRQRLRLALRDLAAGSAFASMAISGQLPLWATGTFALALVLALFGKRFLTGRSAFSLLLILAAAFGLFGLVFTGALDLVLAACSFAGFISAQRLLTPSSPPVDAQVHLTSLLMVAGGAALSADLLFAAALLSFAVTATFSLGLAVVEETIPEGADFPLRPLGRRLALGAVAAMIGAALFFFLFPRLSWNLAARKNSPGLGAPITGMADRVSLGGSGSIKTNPRVVLRAELSPDPGVEELGAYWIGTAFSTFTGREWIGEGELGPPRNQIELGPSGKTRLHQQIELLPAYGARVLVAMDPPILVANATAHWPSYSARIRLQEIEGQEVRVSEQATSYTYHAFSVPAGERVRPDAMPEPGPYLQLPEGLDPRVKTLAEQVVGSDRDPASAARKLEQYLQANYGYTLELAQAEDPLANFLFERGEGHCEHFATAMAVMLRTLGIPARVAGGFYGGERVADRYVVRAGDAHAWTQVLVPGRGFVTFDATPPNNRVAQAPGYLSQLISLYESVEEWWRSRIVDYTILDQARVVRSLVRPPREASGAPSGGPSLNAWIAAALAALAAYGVWRLPKRGARPDRHQATGLLETIEATLAEHHIPVGDGQGVEEVAARLLEVGHPLGDPLSRASRRYLEARFGTRPLEDGELAYWERLLGEASRRFEQRAA